MFNIYGAVFSFSICKVCCVPLTLLFLFLQLRGLWFMLLWIILRSQRSGDRIYIHMKQIRTKFKFEEIICSWKRWQIPTRYNTLHVAKMLKITTTSYRGWSVSGVIPSFSALWLVLLVSETLREMNDIEMGTTATRPTDQLIGKHQTGRARAEQQQTEPSQ